MRESVCKMVKGVKGGHPFGLYRVSSGLVWVPDWVFSITRPNRPNKYCSLETKRSRVGSRVYSRFRLLSLIYIPAYIYLYIYTYT